MHELQIACDDFSGKYLGFHSGSSFEIGNHRMSPRKPGHWQLYVCIGGMRKLHWTYMGLERQPGEGYELFVSCYSDRGNFDNEGG